MLMNEGMIMITVITGEWKGDEKVNELKVSV